MCFGVRDIIDTRFALMQQTIDAGADPHTWQNRERGKFYLEADGISLERFATPNKALWVRDREQVLSAVRLGARYRKPLSDVTARALGPAWAQYQRDLARGDTRWQQLASGLVAPVDVDDNENDVLEDRSEEMPGGWSQEAYSARVSTAAADQIVLDWIADRRDKGGQPFKFAEICEDVLPKIERSKTWLNLRLKNLIHRKVLPPKDDRDLYRVNFPQF